MLITTATGSRYEFNDDLTKFRRAEVGSDSDELRQDGDWLEILDISDIEVGQPVRIVMPVLDPPEFAGAQVTYRTTSDVVSIETSFVLAPQDPTNPGV